MNELNFHEEAVNDEVGEENFEIYNDRVMDQEEITCYKEIPEKEEFHLIERPVMNNEIVIVRNPSEHPLFSEVEDNNFGPRIVMQRRGLRLHPFNRAYWKSRLRSLTIN
jgi:hypothetical protein